MTGVRITVSPGELLDRLTILEVRAARTSGKVQAAAARERDALWRQAVRLPGDGTELARLRTALGEVNATVWDAEDVIRLCLKAGEFGPVFVSAARIVHEKNNERARLRAEVNRLLGAPAEEKVKE